MTDESEIHNNLEFNEANNLVNSTNNILFTSKIHQFENLPESRNATEEELEAFHSKSYDFSIPANINDFNNKSSNQNNSRTSKINSFFKANSKKLSKIFKKLQVKDVQQTKGPNVNFNDDEDEVYNNPNLHSEEQDELEIPNDI
ncbi:uncharacterized protein OCT59_026039 [Rhizophagus irregularis]|nr:hypothetical protein OCT59_026039 [Rhizophagus irregularis]CAB5349858.1 unnamed protein product [Rhizophagus irregularis]